MTLLDWAREKPAPPPLMLVERAAAWLLGRPDPDLGCRRDYALVGARRG